ncbi:hypothetical protein ISF54_30860, partial [Burkholderia pseudomallei]|nr:hypothetical protein [Burkholderia pseudomallei]
RRPARSICNSAANRIRNPFKQCPGRQNEALFNSLLEAVEGDAEGQSLLAILKAQYEPDQLPAKILGAIIDGSFETHEEVRSVLGVQEADYRNAWKVLMRAATKLEPKE